MRLNGIEIEENADLEEIIDSEETTDYEDDGFYGEVSEEELKRLMASRKERYTEGYNRPIKLNRQVSQQAMIASMVVLFLFYVVLFVLNVTNVLPRLTMILIMAPVTLGVVILYFYAKKKSGN